MDLLSTGQLLGVIAGGALCIGFFGKWLINDWYKKSEELEKLKSKYTDRSIENLNKTAHEITSEIRSLKIKMENHTIKMTEIVRDHAHLQDKLKQAMVTLEEITNGAKVYVKQEIRSQLLILSEELKMLKGKKSGKP